MRAHQLAAGLFLAAAGVAAQPLALTGATLHPVSRPPIADGVLLLDGGRILSADRDVAIPPGATVLDLGGKHLYPGFVHPLSVLGLTGITALAASRDDRERGDLHPELRAESSFHANSPLLPAALAGGIVAAHVVPRGGVVAGSSAALSLSGGSWEERLLRAPVGQHVFFPELRPYPASGPEAGRAARRQLDELRRLFAAARAYRGARRAGGADLPLEEPRLEALQPVLDGSATLFLHADGRLHIEDALAWAEEEGLLASTVLIADADAALLGERLARLDLPVVLESVLTLPQRRWEPYDTPYTAAARLYEAGVRRLAIADGGTARDAPNARNLPFEAAMAAAFGLPRDAALASVTLRAAEILGVADRLGSLDPGKEASFLVTDGDPLEIVTHIEQVWVRGQRVVPAPPGGSPAPLP